MHVSMFCTWLTARLHLAERDSRGANMIEYVLLVMLIALVVLVAVQFFGTETSTKYSDAAESVTGS